MFQTIADELEVFANAQLYDDNAYYAIDGCVFSYKVNTENVRSALSTNPASYLYKTEASI